MTMAVTNSVTLSRTAASAAPVAGPSSTSCVFADWSGMRAGLRGMRGNFLPERQPVRMESAAPTAAYDVEEEEESEEDITAAYEALYGKAFEGLPKSPTGEEGTGEEEEGRGRGRRGERGERGERGGDRRGRQTDGMEERVVQIRRVTKVVKGGKQMSFRAVVVIGDKKGTVGVGVGSAKEVITAVQKSATDARRHLVQVPMTKYLTFPHRYIPFTLSIHSSLSNKTAIAVPISISKKRMYQLNLCSLDIFHWG